MSHRVVAAIDFGTHGAGFAWCIVNELNRDRGQREIYTFDGWEDSPVATVKNRSCVLLDPEGEILAWGHHAERLWSSEGAVDGRRYSTGFKMSLGKPRAQAGAGLSEGTGVVAESVEDVTELIVLVLREVARKALEQITNTGVYTADDVRWCVTIPAVWDDHTKDRMYQAAVAAGLPDDPDRLLLSIEPEAAALYAIVKGEATLTVSGTRFMVVDAGGGTIDITSYAVSSSGKLSQLARANGDKAGSEYLNKEFVDRVLVDRLGASFLSAVSHEMPSELFELVQAWERAKKAVTLDDTGDIRLSLTADLHARLQDDTEAINRLRERQDGVTGSIRITGAEVKAAFEAVIATVVVDVQEQLDEMRAVSGRSGGEVALLVGGFAQSPYLVERLRAVLAAQNVRLHVPERPGAAVVFGAAHFAYDPSDIIERRSPLTYGTDVAMPFREGIDPHAKRVVDDEGVVWCSDRFHPYVCNGDRVPTDSRETSGYQPVFAAADKMHIRFFASRQKDVEYITDPGVEEVGDVTVDISDTLGRPKDQRGVRVTLFFGETRIRAEAVTDSGGGESVQTQITWRPVW